jgi:thioredoxin 1
MKAFNFAVTASILSIAVLAPAMVSDTKPGAWGTNLPAAISAAKGKTNLILVDFNASWCGPCQKYKKEVFRSDEFKKATKEIFLVDIDVDKQAPLAEKYKVSEIPDIRIVTADGKVVGRILGYAGQDGLLKAINEAKRKAGIK